RIGAALAGRDRDLADDLGEDLAALGVGGVLACFDGGTAPHGKAPVVLESRRFYWKQAPGAGSRLPPLLRGLAGMAEAAGVQEIDRLRDRLGREQQAAVAGRDHDVVGQLRAAGFGDRNRAVVV